MKKYFFMTAICFVFWVASFHVYRALIAMFEHFGADPTTAIVFAVLTQVSHLAVTVATAKP